MSYAQMDHAGWVENNNEAGRCLYKQPSRDSYGTVIGFHAAPDKLTDFQAKAMDILGMVGGGIYNAPISWKTVDWNCGSGIALTWKRSMATFDFASLTRLVLLCHEARIRCDISPYGFQNLRLTLHPRAHNGGMSKRHPNIDEAVAEFRAYLPVDHRIIYRAPEAAAQPGPEGDGQAIAALGALSEVG